MRYITLIVAILLASLASIPAHAQTQLSIEELCTMITDQRIQNGTTPQSDRSYYIQTCIGQNQRTSRPATPRGQDTVAAIETDSNRRIREMRESYRLRTEMQREQQINRIELDRYAQISQAHTANEVAAIRASAPYTCAVNGQVTETQANFNVGPIFGPAVEYGVAKVLGGRTNRDASVAAVSQAAGTEVQGMFTDQSRTRTDNCAGTYLAREMPGVSHQGVVSGALELYNRVRN